MKNKMMLVMSLMVVGCGGGGLTNSPVEASHTQAYLPSVCVRNYQFCVQSYIGSREDFCRMHDDCTPQHWDELCKADMRVCREEQ
jgi:hypothetical protein